MDVDELQTDDEEDVADQDQVVVPKPDRDARESLSAASQGDAGVRAAPVSVLALPPIQHHPSAVSGGGLQLSGAKSGLTIPRDVPIGIVLGALACVGVLSAVLGVACWACQRAAPTSGSARGGKRGHHGQSATARYTALRRESVR